MNIEVSFTYMEVLNIEVFFIYGGPLIEVSEVSLYQ